MKFFIYSRKSVYTGKGESVENQIELCKQYLRAKFSDALESDWRIYEEEGFSGKNTARPQFQKMLRDLVREKPDYVVCYRLDRISRSVSDFSALIEELNRRGISFVCIKEEFDTSKPMGKAMMYIASVFAQLERETIAERVRDNMLLLARTGRWLGGTPPTGFTSEKLQELVLDGKMKISCNLKQHPEEMQIVDAIFGLFLQRQSLSGVCKQLIQKGIRSRSGKWYAPLGVKEILQNPVYCVADEAALDYFTAHHADICFTRSDCSSRYGLLAYNKRDYKKKHAPRQGMDQWIVAIGKHEGRVSGEQWVAVQRLLAENIPNGKTPAPMHNDYALLSGRIFCAQCGSRLFAKRRSSSGEGGLRYDYLCAGKLRGGASLCACQNLGGGQTDALVWAELTPYLKASAHLEILLEKLRRELRGQGSEDPLATLETRIRQCQEELARLVEVLAQKEAGADLVRHISQRVTELEEEMTTLFQQRTQLRQEKRIEGKTDQIDQMANELSDLTGTSFALSVAEKRAFLKLLVRRIVWDGKELYLDLGEPSD